MIRIKSAENHVIQMRVRPVLAVMTRGRIKIPLYIYM